MTANGQAVAVTPADTVRDRLDDPQVAAVMADVSFTSFYGSKVDFYGTDTYGSRQQMRLPVTITQVKDGNLVEKTRLVPSGK